MLEEYRDRIVAAIQTWPDNNPFTLKQLLHDEWPADKGQAIRLGTEFRQSVVQEFPQLEIIGENGRNHEVYRKR